MFTLCSCLVYTASQYFLIFQNERQKYKCSRPLLLMHPCKIVISSVTLLMTVFRKITKHQKNHHFGKLWKKLKQIFYRPGIRLMLSVRCQSIRTSTFLCRLAGTHNYMIIRRMDDVRMWREYPGGRILKFCCVASERT